MKYKKISPDYFITILDRLNRFYPAYERYKRVFDDIINKYSLDEKLKTLSLNDEIKYVEEIINNSVDTEYDPTINEIIKNLEEKYFKINELSYQYLSARINISGMLKKIDKKIILPKNIAWLNYVDKNSNIIDERRKNNLLYPIEKIILCEGQTEYTLLETIFNLFNVNLNKEGILIMPAGGKNQVARKYYSMIEYTKIPFFILLDKDAGQIKEIIDAKLRDKDDIYLIKSGEFEDLIPRNILKRTINIVHCNDYNCIFDDFEENNGMVLCLENIYKKYGFGEFKKAKFALELKNYIQNNVNKEEFEESEIIDIIKALHSK